MFITQPNMTKDFINTDRKLVQYCLFLFRPQVFLPLDGSGLIMI